LLTDCPCKEIELQAFRKLRTVHTKPKKQQTDSIATVLGKKAVVVILLTEFGKTITSASQPFAFDIARLADWGSLIILCVSPLVALMEDQSSMRAT
jgi:superfamily II DNA helicase RecQ